MNMGFFQCARQEFRIDDASLIWYITPKMKAQLIIHNKITDEYGNTVEIKMWRVAKAVESPHGYKYSLVYIVDGRRVIGYDNAESKGDHRHYDDREEPYTFRSLRKLVGDFSKDIKRFTEKLYESKKS